MPIHSTERLKKSMDLVYNEINLKQRDQALRALQETKLILEERLNENSQFDGVVTIQAILWSLQMSSQDLAVELTSLLLRDTTKELSELLENYKQYLRENKTDEARLALTRAYVCAITFVPNIVCPRVPLLIASFSQHDKDKYSAISLILDQIRPKLDKARWYEWKYSPEIINLSSYKSAEVLIHLADNLMGNSTPINFPGLDNFIEKSFHLIVNALDILGDCQDEVYALGMNVFGRIYQSLGFSQYEESLNCFLKCIEVETRLKRFDLVARDNMNAGVINVLLMQLYNFRNEIDKTEDFQKKAEFHLVDARKFFEAQNNVSDLVMVLTNLGSFYSIKREWLMAEDQYLQAWNLLGKLSGDQSYLCIKIAANLASVYCDLTEYRKSLEYLDIAFERFESSLVKDLEVYILCNATRGKVLYNLGRVDEAYYNLKEALNNLEELRTSFVSERTNMELLKVFHWVYEYIIICCVELGSNDPDKYSEGFAILEQVKWRSLTVLLKYLPLGMINASDHPLVAEEEKLLESEYGALIGNPSEAIVSSLYSEALFQRLEQIWDELEDEYPEYISIRRQKTVTFTEVKRLLDEEVSTLVEYYYGLESGVSIVFIIQKDSISAKGIRLNGSTEEIIRLIRELRNISNTDSVKIFNDISFKLYQLLFEPLKDLCKDNKGICFVPFGELHNLSFNTLYNGSSYLIESNLICISPTSSALRWLNVEKSRTPTSCKLFTATNKSIVDDKTLYDLYLFRNLAETKIAPLFSKSNINPSSDTSKHYLTNLLNTNKSLPDIIHIACHGISCEDGLSSFLVMGDDLNKSNQKLTALEIMSQFRLSSSLVTLCACHSAVVIASTGDDLSGLAHAFLFTGADSVLASNVYVLQGAGVLLTRTFYETWIRTGYSKIAALQNAQLITMRKKTWFGKLEWHPQQWGAFQLYGSWK